MERTVFHGGQSSADQFASVRCDDSESRVAEPAVTCRLVNGFSRCCARLFCGYFSDFAFFIRVANVVCKFSFSFRAKKIVPPNRKQYETDLKDSADKIASREREIVSGVVSCGNF